MANKLNKSDIDKLVGKSQSRQIELVDGNNLYLIVTKIGSCKFKYRIRTQDKASWVVIGDYPDITLNEARKKALEIRAMLANGIDPNLVKRQDQARQITLNALFDQYVKDRLHLVRRNEKSRRNYTTSVQSGILNIIGNMKVGMITDEIIRTQLLAPKIENGCASVARLILINIKILLDFAIELGIIEYNPATKIKTSNIYRDKPRTRHLSYKEISTFLNLLYSAPIKTQNKFALHLSLLILTRKTELVHATWDSINFEAQTFTIK